jgi:colanic acid biosynthesis glycosyl transferase WcaI
MASKKHILVVSQHFWPETFRINDVCNFLVEKNSSIDVLCGIPNYPKGRFFQGYSFFKSKRQKHNGVNIRRAIEIPRGNNSNFHIFVNYVSFPIASLFHIPRLLTKKYDKIFLYQTSPVMMSIAGIIVGKIKKIETTMYVLDLWPENLYSVIEVNNKLLRFVALAFSNWHYKNVDKLVVLSKKMKDRLIENTGISEDRIIVLPQACEKIYETEVKDKKIASRFKGRFNILFTGSITPAQSFGTIISAAKNLKNQGVDDLNWIIVGDGMSKKWLEDEVKKNHLEDCFYFEGLKPIEEIAKYTTMADILVGCLVKSELLEATIPAKVLSYIAAGKPIVLAMDGEVQDLINNTIKCGFAGPAGNAKAFTDNIKRMHDLSDQEREKLGENGQAYHFKHFERNIILSKLYDFIFG